MKTKRFSSENIMMSFVGHLALVAFMVSTFTLVIERAKLVAPDRVQITEIDLSQIKITRDKTELYNTAEPTVQKIEKTDFPKPKEQEVEKKAIETPSLVEKQEIKKPKENVSQKAGKDDKSNAPKRKTTVRVNRETTGLDRTMTISVVDALRVALTRCWVIDTKRDDIQDIRAVAHIRLHNTGVVRDVWFESAARVETDPAFAYVIDTISDAIKTCDPFQMLPKSEFEHWEKIQLNFYPSQGTIM